MDGGSISKNLVPGSRCHKRIVKALDLVEPPETFGQSSRGALPVEADASPLDPDGTKPVNADNTDQPDMRGGTSELYAPFQAIMDLQRFGLDALQAELNDAHTDSDALRHELLEEFNAAQEDRDARRQKLLVELNAAHDGRDALRDELLVELNVAREGRDALPQELLVELNAANEDRDARRQELLVERNAARDDRDAFRNELLMEHNAAHEDPDALRQDLLVELRAAQNDRDALRDEFCLELNAAHEDRDALRQELLVELNAPARDRAALDELLVEHKAVIQKLRRSGALANLIAQRYKLSEEQESAVAALHRKMRTERNLAEAKEQLAFEEYHVEARDYKYEVQYHDILSAEADTLRKELNAARSTLASIRHMSSDDA